MGDIPEIYQSWNPRHINTDGQMVMWLNPNSIDETGSGTSIAEWPDDGNLGYKAVQPVAEDKPEYYHSDLYGEPCLNFDDANTEYLTCGVIPELEVGLEDFGYAAIVMFAVRQSAVQVVLHKQHRTEGGSSGGGITFRQMGDGGAHNNERRSQAGGAATKALFAAASDTQDTNVFHIFASSRTNGVLNCWVDGTWTASNATDGSDNYNINNLYPAGTPISFIIGGVGPDGTDKCMDGILGDIVVVSGTMGKGSRQKLEGFLAHKWSGIRGSIDPNLGGSLPATHPYKTVKPSGSLGITMGDGSSGTASSLYGECAGGLNWFTNEVQSASRG